MQIGLLPWLSFLSKTNLSDHIVQSETKAATTIQQATGHHRKQDIDTLIYKEEKGLLFCEFHSNENAHVGLLVILV